MRLVVALLAVLPAAAEPVSYTLGPSATSQLRLEVAKTGLMSGRIHVFEFPAFRGRLQYDAARPENSRVQLEISAAELQLKDEWLSPGDQRKVRDYALRDMLEAERHPKLTYESTRVEPQPGGGFQVEGLLTIRAVSRPVTLEVRKEETVAGGLSFSGRAAFRMTSFGLKPPSAALGAIGTRDEMQFSFRLAAVAP